jgi:prolyl-tRNA editing enzyme YbaK/EbsC (Cys-tRNA(Pro) deacylase)
MAVVPADAQARRVGGDHLLDDAPPRRLRDALGLDHDPVSNVRSHRSTSSAATLALQRLDLRKLREIHGGGRHAVHLATEEDLRRDYPEFELGAVPPVGGRRDPVVVDLNVANRKSVVIEAGSHNESLRLAAADLVHVAGAPVTDISADG